MVTFIRGNFYFGLRMQNSSTISLLLNKMVEHYGLLFSDKIITNNSPARDEILKRLGKRKDVDVQLLYNNIPPMSIREEEDVLQTRDKYGIPGNAKVLVTAGILTSGKNIEILLRCLPKIGIESLYLLIVGDSYTESDRHNKATLKALSNELNIEKQVIFTGWLEKEELWKSYLASDLFVLPSISEGMPNAMLEALGVNLPCFGSRIPGVRDILQYDELMFDPQGEKALTNKIQNFFTEKQFSGKVKRLCQARKEVFSFDWKEKVFQLVTERTLGRSKGVER